MAAEALEGEGKRLGHKIKVETRGSVGAKNQLTDEDIANADLVIIAADIEVPLERFNGKLLYRTSTGLALKKTKQEVALYSLKRLQSIPTLAMHLRQTLKRKKQALTNT